MNHFEHITELGPTSNLLGIYFLKILMNFLTSFIQQSSYSVGKEALWSNLLQQCTPVHHCQQITCNTYLQLPSHSEITNERMAGGS